MNNSNPTQAARVLKYMETFGSITQIEALNVLGVMRLASRVSELKKQGFPVISKIVPVKNRFGETCYIKQYSIKEEA